MGEEILIKHEEIKEHVDRLAASVEEFSNYNKDFLEETILKISDMNSDFTSKMTDVLTNMKDTVAGQLYLDLKGYVSDVRIMTGTFETIDSVLPYYYSNMSTGEDE